ncbi:MAG: Ppx/GppA family phosphatase [Methanomassiliicoccales archaeon]|nr:Ppx/GppA family phosphatase [Methanomassiliicoccales archaeon]MDD1755997.1 Ppx/GppA family phosphatase [Methanomassiliicoccales archaeon]
MSFPGKVVSFIDIGTNSIRTAVVRLNPNYSYSILSRQKQVVRLGENEFLEHRLIPAAMERCVVVCKRFVEMGRAYGAEEFVAVATSATREARNQGELLERLRTEVGIEVKVISGKEEARLIYLGVSSAFHLEDRFGVFIDIGGGSTEVSVGNQSDYVYLDSLKLGAIRLSELFISEGETGPVYPEKYAQMKKSVRGEIVRTVQRVKRYKLELAVGTSGTVINLGEVAARNLNGMQGKDSSLTLAKLKKTIALLCSLDLKERRALPGINPERADIIIGGAAILETLMEEIGLQEVVISERGLLDGMLVDFLSQIEGFPSHQRMSVRERSVLQLGRSCNLDELHAETISRISLEMFDSAKEEGVHGFGAKERELLRYASYLHDIGDFISFSNHHQHSYYIIRNAELLGFDQREIEIMASLARFHRKKSLGRKSSDLEGLDAPAQRVVVALSAFLRIAEALDRSHCALIDHARFINATEDEAVLEVSAKGDCQLELWGAESQGKGFMKAFDRELRIRFKMSTALDEAR